MSVLIEAACLVIPRLCLDLSYEGGSSEFLRVANAVDDTRFAIADDRLVCVSAFGPDEILRLVAGLVAVGLVASDSDGNAVDFVYVDQETGPTLPCPWFGFERHKHGFTHGWDVRSGTAGQLETPDGWRLEDSWRLTRSDSRDDGSDWQRLASEDGFETWLDFRTGGMNFGLTELPRRLVVDPGPALAARAPEVESKTPDAVQALGRSAAMLHALLIKAGIPYQLDLEHRCAVVPFATDTIDRVQVMAIPVRDDAVHFAAVLPHQCSRDDVGSIRDFGRAFASEFPGWAIVVDDTTRSIHVTSVVSGLDDATGMERLERALCAAADRAGATSVAMDSAIRGEASVQACLKCIRVASA